jgi:hypothetical protein
LLILVDPAGWDPFGEPVGVDATGPAFLQEVGVVVPLQTFWQAGCEGMIGV